MVWLASKVEEAFFKEWKCMIWVLFRVGSHARTPPTLVQVYASTPFKLRKGLHKEAAQWISDRHRRDFRDRADVMPMLINHLTQAHEEARAQAMLAVLKVQMKYVLGSGFS